MKKTIRLNESDLHRIVKETVKKTLKWKNSLRENVEKYYAVQDEADGAIHEFTTDFDEAVEDAKNMGGHMVVVDCETDEVLFDTMPGITHKF